MKMENKDTKKYKDLIIGWGLFQALAKKQVGLKIQYLRSMERVYTLFVTKQEAEIYLANLLMVIKMEQGQGIRTADNLDPEVKLDFLIKKVYIPIERDDEDFKKRGWSFEKNDEVDNEEEFIEKMNKSLDEWQATSATAQKIHEDLKNEQS